MSGSRTFHPTYHQEASQHGDVHQRAGLASEQLLWPSHAYILLQQSGTAIFSYPRYKNSAFGGWEIIEKH